MASMEKSGRKKVSEYLDVLEGGKEDRPDQVKQGLEIYIELWRRVIEKGIVDSADEMDVALAKVDAAGGLQKAAE